MKVIFPGTVHHIWGIATCPSGGAQPPWEFLAFPEGHLTTFVSIVMGVPQLFVREHPIKYIKMDDLGLPPFMETSIVVFPEYVRNYGRPRPSTSWWFPAGSYIVSTGWKAEIPWVANGIEQ